MRERRRFALHPVRVSVGTVGGDTCAGLLHVFAPDDADLVLEPLPDTEPSTPRRMRVEDVSYVAFHGDVPRIFSTAAVGRSVPLRIHVTGGRVFRVRTHPDAVSDPLGFYATPADEGTEWHEIFFFAHGVNVAEQDASLGSLLVEGGLIVHDELERGVELQAAAGRKRIGEILLEQNKIAPEKIAQAVALQKRRGIRIGDVLVEAGLASREDVEAALSDQRRSGGKRLGEILVDMGIVSERDLAMTLANKFHLAFVDLEECIVDDAAVHEIPLDLLRKRAILPIDSDARQLTIALSDPLDTESIDFARFHTRKRVREVVVAPGQLREYLDRILESLAHPGEGGAVDEDIFDELVEEVRTEPDEPDDASSLRESDSAVIRLANRILVDAYRRGASDIHVEPNGRERNLRVRFRIDGECVAYQDVPAAYRAPLVSRLKILAGLDISERRKPQDGKILLRLPKQTVELRVATLPTVHDTEDVVMRILADAQPRSLDELELSERNAAEMKNLMRQPHGLLLCVGPTGSGKTTTLHSALSLVNDVGTKIWTAEDPVEISQPGLRQVQVRPRIGFGFAEALRAFLRADPDVIMVGEMRDEETAHIAVEASLTGHLVLSTLHTNSAAETITRLIDMGLDPFAFADSLLGVLAQRLVRRVCASCRESCSPTPEEHKELANVLERDPDELDAQLWRGRGCEACGNSGYRGRVALHELLVADDGLRHAIEKRASADDIRELAARGGMTSLLRDGVEKCLTGLTDPAQVFAACRR